MALLILAGFLAGVQNALAGGGSFLTFPALLLAGLDARAANVTSTVALFPGQVATGWVGRGHVEGAEGLSFRRLAAISLVGGAAGAGLLLATPAAFFSRLVPWLVLFATAVFAWGSFAPGGRPRRLGRGLAMAAQFAIAVYGGYFGGGIGILMLAALTFAGLSVAGAGATKNVLAAAMNAAAVVIFAFSAEVHWRSAAVLGLGALAGGQAGAWVMFRVPPMALRIGVVAIGLALTFGLFLRG